MVMGPRAFRIALSAALLLLVLPVAPPSLGTGEGNTVFGDDLTPTTGTTGDAFVFRIFVSDPDGLLSVAVIYSYGTGSEIIAPMSTDGPGQPFTFDIYLSPEPETLHYRLRAEDALGNRQDSEQRHVPLTDNDPPEVLFDSSGKFAEAGSTFTFSAELSDNDEVGSAWVIFWFDDGARQNLTLIEGHPYNQEVPVPPFDVTILSYYFEVMDCYGNSLRTQVKVVSVLLDITAPRFGRDSTPREGTTGDELKFLVEVYDEGGLWEVRVRYRTGEGTVTNRSMEGPSPYILTIGLPLDSIEDLNYSFFAMDEAGNNNHTAWKHVRVRDNDLPVPYAGEDREVQRGATVTLNATGSYDNIGIRDYSWYFDYDDQVQRLFGNVTTFKFARTGQYTVRLTVRDAAENSAIAVVNITVVQDTIPGGPSAWVPREPKRIDPLTASIPLVVAAIGAAVWAWNYSLRR